jgi:hypothetical protein
MFFDYKIMQEFGYNIIGLNFEDPKACYNYVKYFPETYALVIYVTKSNKGIYSFHLDKDKYDKFTNSEIRLYVKESSKVFCVGEIKNRKEMSKYLAEAEAYAKSNSLIRGRLIEISDNEFTKTI